MVYLLAAIANDSEYTPALLYALGAELAVPPSPADSDEIWGIGYYADNRALIIRKPAELPQHVAKIVVRARVARVQRHDARKRGRGPFRFTVLGVQNS